MNIDSLDYAVEEAARFLAAARTAVKRIKQEPDLVNITGSKETGACRRASMDLTRALALLRKP